MKAILTAFRWIFSFFLGLFIIILLLITPIILSVSTLLTQRQYISRWINDSGIYNESSKLAITQLKEKLSEQGLSIKEIKTLEPSLNKSITPTLMRNISESAIHGVYNWLEGKTKSIEINTERFDLSLLLKDILPSKIIDNPDFNRLFSNLKPCSVSQENKLKQNGGFTSIEELCIPSDLSLINVEGNSNPNAKVINIDNIFQIPEISQENAKLILTVYNTLKYSTYIVSGFILLILALWLIVTPTKLFKLYSLSFILIITCGLSMFFWKSSQLLSKFPALIISALPQFNNNNLIPNELIENLFSIVLNDLSRNAFNISLYLLLLGAFILLISIILHILKIRNTNARN